MAKDPICGMEVDEKDARFMVRFGHETFYFCSKSCEEQFGVKMGLLPEGAGKLWWRRMMDKLFKPKEPPPKCH